MKLLGEVSLEILAGKDNSIAHNLTEMNARMRRIDLFCKLMGPLAISLVAIASTKIAIYTTLVMNMLSVVVEYSFIGQVRQRGVCASKTHSQ